MVGAVMRYDAELVRIIDERIGQALPSRPSRMGTVQTRDLAAGACTVIFDGDVVPVPVKVAAHVVARPGDRVGLQLFEGEWVVVLGFAALSSASIETLGTNLGTITSTSNQLVAAASTTVTKALDGTRMRVHINGGGWAQTALGAGYELFYGVRISRASPAFAADYDVGRYFFNAVTDHRAWSAHKTITAIPAGSYTMQLYLRHDRINKQTNLNIEDPWSVLWEEIH